MTGRDRHLIKTNGLDVKMIEREREPIAIHSAFV